MKRIQGLGAVGIHHQGHQLVLALLAEGLTLARVGEPDLEGTPGRAFGKLFLTEDPNFENVKMVGRKDDHGGEVCSLRRGRGGGNQRDSDKKRQE